MTTATRSWVTTDEAAEILSLTPGRIRQLARALKLTGSRTGRDWMFKESDVRRFKRIRASRA